MQFINNITGTTHGKVFFYPEAGLVYGLHQTLTSPSHAMYLCIYSMYNWCIIFPIYQKILEYNIVGYPSYSPTHHTLYSGVSCSPLHYSFYMKMEKRKIFTGTASVLGPLKLGV